MEKTIITCALTGAETTKEQCPNLPLTPQDLAQAALECQYAGASIVHLHVRDKQGRPTSDISVFKETIELIRRKSSIVIEITTGGAVGMTPQERIAPVSLEPDMASLDCGTVNFGNEYIINTLPIMRQFASQLNKYKVHPTLECFDISHIISSKILIKENLLRPPYHYGFVMNVPSALPYNHKTLSDMISQLPENSDFTVIGIGRAHLPAIFGALSFGGHIRVGFEDNIYFSKGKVADSNAQFVERAAFLVKQAQREIATADDVRKFFGLRS